MTRLAVSLLGKFRAERDNKQLDGLEAGKVKELFSYLLIHRGRPQSRDRLAELLWNNQPPAISRKYLRQTLWKLKSALGRVNRKRKRDLHSEFVDDGPARVIAQLGISPNNLFEGTSQKARRSSTKPLCSEPSIRENVRIGCT